MQSNDAIVSLVLGIVSFIICPVVPAIIAIVFGGKAKKAIDASGGMLTGRGMATAGVILGWVNLALSALVAVFWVVLVIAAAGSGSY